MEGFILSCASTLGSHGPAAGRPRVAIQLAVARPSARACLTKPASQAGLGRWLWLLQTTGWPMGKQANRATGNWQLG